MGSNDSSLYDISWIQGDKLSSLYDLATWKNGLAFKKIDFSEFGRPVIKIAELNNGITGSTAYTDGAYSSEVFVTKGDYVFSWSGNPQTSIDIFRYNLPDGWLNQHIFKVVPDESVVDRNYFYFLMKVLKPVFSAIATNKQTTGLGHITIADLKRIHVSIPDMQKQKRIAAVLSSMENQIDCLNRTNRHLLECARELFLHEVVSGDDSWEEASLLDIADYRNGLAMQKFRPEGSDEGLPVLKIRELREGRCGTDSERCKSDIDESAKVFDGDVIFSWSGSLLIDLWAGGDAGLNQHLFKVTSKRYPKWFYYLWTDYHLPRFVSMAADRATTMGHIKRSALENATVAIPPKSDLEELDGVFGPMVDLIVTGKVEVRRLERLRDTLLPMLMSGEIDVSEL